MAPKTQRSTLDSSGYPPPQEGAAEFIHRNKLPFLEGAIIECVVNGSIKNLKQAAHYLEMLIRFEEEDINEYQKTAD